jgi:cytochrome P450
VVEFVEPFIGSVNMLTSSGPLWKKWRAAFNPGFSTQHLICQIPMFVDCCREFVRLLDDHANTKRVFRMEEEVGLERSLFIFVTYGTLGNKDHDRCHWQSHLRTRLPMSDRW